MNPNIIIPCWILDEETLHLTENAIESIRKGAPDCQMIIIDNGSTHGAARLRELADIYVRNKENLGYAKAVNQGLKLAGSVVAIANNDIVVSSNWWEIAKKILTVYPNVGSVHYRMIPYGDDFNLGEEYWIEGKERWCSSSFFVVRNGQLYDEKFLNSCDDWDYWFRMRQLGYTTAYTNAAEYKHKDSHSQQKRLDRIENDKMNYEYYKEKHGEYPDIQFSKMYPEQMLVEYRPMP